MGDGIEKFPFTDGKHDRKKYCIKYVAGLYKWIAELSLEEILK